MRGNAGDSMARDAARYSQPDGDIDAHGGEERAGLISNNNGQVYNEQEKERLVKSAVAELYTHVQEQQPSRIEPPPSGTLSTAVASAEDENTCVVCLAAQRDSLLLPCKHMTMCAECTEAVLSSSSQPQCPVCGSSVVDCIYGL
jgi:hypothetical protein